MTERAFTYILLCISHSAYNNADYNTVTTPWVPRFYQRYDRAGYNISCNGHDPISKLLTSWAKIITPNICFFFLHLSNQVISELDSALSLAKISYQTNYLSADSSYIITYTWSCSCLVVYRSPYLNDIHFHWREIQVHLADLSSSLTLASSSRS